jgi:hypothetical protein
MRGTRSDQRYRTLYLIAGVASILYVLLSLSALAVDVIAPPPVTGGAETLEFIADHTATYVAEQLLWIVPSILPVLTYLGLYIALRDTCPSWALVGVVVGALPWALLLALPVSSRGSLVLVTLSDWYRESETPEARAAYATAAEAIIAENNTPGILGVLAAVGIIVISVLMTRSPLPRTVAWLGIATGAVGVLSELLRYLQPSFYAVYGLLLWTWFAMVGVSLLRRAARMPRRVAPAPAAS